jgi:TPR repeat protein
MFGLFGNKSKLDNLAGKKSLSTVTAHISDPVHGYSKQIWTVGQHFPWDTNEKLYEDGNLFVFYAYEDGMRTTAICSRDIWNNMKAQDDIIDAEMLAGEQARKKLFDGLREEQYRKADVQGNAAAQYDLGMMYADGKDYKQAAEWFSKAAAQGHADAQFMLGLMYTDGKDVPQDYKQAAEWFSKAAAQGDADAQCILGGMYSEGKGVPQDDKQAVEWYRKAAAQGDADAQQYLETHSKK